MDDYREPADPASQAYDRGYDTAWAQVYNDAHLRVAAREHEARLHGTEHAESWEQGYSDCMESRVLAFMGY